MTSLLPSRTDFVFNFFTRFTGRRPVLLGVLYFFVCFGGLLLLSLVTGVFNGNEHFDPLLAQVMNNLNLAVLAPIGAMLLANLYYTIEETFEKIITNSIVEESPELKNFTSKLRLLIFSSQSPFE